MSTRTKSVEVWALADQYGFLLAHGNPNAERQDGGEPPCPPYHVVSFLYESDFFWNHIVWARRKWELDETGRGGCGTAGSAAVMTARTARCAWYAR